MQETISTRRDTGDNTLCAECGSPHNLKLCSGTLALLCRDWMHVKPSKCSISHMKQPVGVSDYHTGFKYRRLIVLLF